MAETGCFYGDGTPAVDWTYGKCNNGSSVSFCCGAGDKCLANGLCFGRYPYRGPCSNKGWLGCRSICPEVNSNSWTEVQHCSDDGYCCAPGRNAGKPGDCCNDGSRRFTLPDLPATSASSATSSHVSDSSATFTPTSGASSPAFSTASSAPAPATSLTSGSIAGVAIGSAAGAALIVAAIAWWLFARRRRQQPDEQTRKTALPSEADADAYLVETDARPTPRYEMI
ncbi:hypothetical protein CP533_4216 [Ophiocordyceps camponoti-saundersi (nom. inval.)]|nr:hypothetical protein CP533_4216 [Ophiocordyceps camponoti-saundersi (nom. inval.)]